MTTKIVTTDKHALYLASVQDPISDVGRISDIYFEIFDKEADLLREDFSGTFAISCCWVESHEDRKAIALDIDEEALNYGKTRYLKNMGSDEQSRVKVLKQNSISKTELVDMICTFNFSYCLLHTRSVLVDYLKKANESLNEEGMIIMDIFGGSDSEIPEVQERNIDNNDQIAPFSFEFVREDFNPINRHANYHINFKYEEGTQVLKAFSYHFRMWSITELRDCLEEAGFSKTLVYWEDFDKEGFGSGEFTQTEKELNSINWNAYVVGVK